MKAQAFKQMLLVGTFGLTAFTMFGCQPKPEVSEQIVQTKQEEQTPLIQAKVAAIPGVQSLLCEKEGCTKYNFLSLKTNVDWIDSYFFERIKRAEPVAFQVQKQVKPENIEVKSLDQRSIRVGYLGQQNNFATFIIKTYQFKTGHEFGLYHNEYVNLDLLKKKRLALDDVLKKGVEAKLLDAIYESNVTWLQAHDIEKTQLKLSDNFYFNAQGLVMVYPLYEMADYTTGMPELKVPYDVVADLLKPEYLPNLAQK